MFYILKKQLVWRSRFLASFIVLCILGGWAAADLPTVILLTGNKSISFQSAQAPAETLYHMLIALVVGVLIIFPALGFLLHTFQSPNINDKDDDFKKNSIKMRKNN